MLILMSAPNLPSVKYNGILYTTEEECLSAQVEFLNMYESRPQTYKDFVTVDAFSCWIISPHTSPVEVLAPSLQVTEYSLSESSRNWAILVALPKQMEHKNKDVKFTKPKAAWEDN